MCGAPTLAEAGVTIDDFSQDPVVVEAENAGQAAWDALQAAEARGADDDEIERLNAAFEAAAVRLRIGLMSGGNLYVDFTKAERRKVGVDKLLWV